MSKQSDFPPLNDHSFLGALQPEKVLLEFEGPIFFASSDASGNPLLAYQCAEHDRLGIYFVASVSLDLISRLEKGKITIAHSLDQAHTWLVDIDLYEWSVAKVIDCPYRSLPEDYRPKPNVYLTTTGADNLDSRRPDSVPTPATIPSSDRHGPTATK